MNKNITTSKNNKKPAKIQKTNSMDKAMSLLFLEMKIKKLKKIKIQVAKPGGFL